MTDTTFAPREIARIVQRWLDYQDEQRKREGLPTDNDTKLMTPPTWPNRGALKNWVAGLNAAADAIENLELANRQSMEMADKRSAENCKLRQENERLTRVITGIAEFCSGDDSALGAIARLAHIRNTADRALPAPQAFIDAKKERDEGWPELSDDEQEAPE